MHESDSRLLGIPETAAQFIARTMIYWHGHKLADSTTAEVLLAPPIRVVRRAV